jgi:hypothetical protein
MNRLKFCFSYWVNGKKDASGNWYAYNPGQVAIYSGAKWFNNDKVNGGDCISGFKSSGLSQMELAATNCGDSYYSFCEFV